MSLDPAFLGRMEIATSEEMEQLGLRIGEHLEAAGGEDARQPERDERAVVAQQQHGFTGHREFRSGPEERPRLALSCNRELLKLS